MKMPRPSLDLLQRAMVSSNSLACCGLDPDVSKMPLELRKILRKGKVVQRFFETVIDLTAPHVCAYKAQKAFFDLLPEGHRLLRKTVQYIQEHHPHLPVFVDAKIGDVGHTMEAYLENIFGKLEADGVVVNPYLGDDVLRPFEKLPNKAALVMVKTSNPQAAVVQDIVTRDGKPLWKYILELTATRWNTAGNMIPILASTAEIDLSDIRTIIPDNMPVLFAGYGVQGGTTQHLREFLDSNGRGVFVNSSRGILYPYEIDDEGWREAITCAVVKMKDDLNLARSRSKFLLVLGVSGVGKSTIIQELQGLDSRFVYISPFMTRALRSGEKDKIPVSDAELDEMEKQGKLVAVNELYGVRYAPPRESIEQAIREERFPVLDWPIERLSVMQRAFPNKLFRAYIEPPDITALRRRLADGRDSEEKRFHAATNELDALRRGSYDNLIDYRATNREGDVGSVARALYAMYLKSMGL